ncbi:hypothetical protein [Stenotrophomonas sp. BIGb0135]|uniref:hypothetical protein n=1 Tax=Stenotrophomonas sp. BIGb0135 TaxID=2940620 RepID=UPI0021688E65|nr:hypothetical protein [Stenotrophomonas sp. BIGb0135]
MTTSAALTLVSILAAGSAAAAQVSLPADLAFQRASELLVEMGALPTFRDKDLLVIRTDPIQVKLAPDQADCGKMFGIPYLKDKRTKTAATYQINIRPIDSTASDVLVKVTLEGYMDVNEGAPFFIEKTRDKNKVLTCHSNGWLESNFYAAMQR